MSSTTDSQNCFVSYSLLNLALALSCALGHVRPVLSSKKAFFAFHARFRAQRNNPRPANSQRLFVARHSSPRYVKHNLRTTRLNSEGTNHRSRLSECRNVLNIELRTRLFSHKFDQFHFSPLIFEHIMFSRMYHNIDF